MPGCLQVVRARLRGHDPFDVAAAVLLAVLVVAAAATFRAYGLSNDEEVQHRYGELILAYYASGFQDRALFEYKNLYLYGGLFDIVAALLAGALPFDLYAIRHAMSALCGIGGIAATWAAARLVAGPRAGFLAALVLASAAPWYGAMFNHTKDIPFAAAMMGALFFLLRAGRDLPRPRWRDTFGFGVLFGAACGLRAMGFLLIGYAGTVALLRFVPVIAAGRAAALHWLGCAVTRFLPAVALGYAIMLAAWPWASLDLFNPIRAIFAFAHFHYEIRTIFAGVVYTMAEVPRWYVPAYLAIKLPLLVFAGAALAAVFALWPRKAPATVSGLNARLDIALLWFAVVFPVACQVVGHGPAFTGMRHFFFVVPPLAALSGIGIDAAIAWLEIRGRGLAAGAAVVVAAAIAWETVNIVRLHPHQYVYYNPLVGGLPGADRRYSMDYWANIMPEAVAGLKALLDADPASRGRRYTVGVCAERFSFEHEADARMEWTPGWYEADFFLAPTQLNCDREVDGKVAVRIERLGVTLGVVKDRRGMPHYRPQR